MIGMCQRNVGLDPAQLMERSLGGVVLPGHLLEMFGDEYRRYRDRVSMLVPWRRSS